MSETQENTDVVVPFDSGFAYAKLMGPRGHYIDVIFVPDHFYKEGIEGWARGLPNEAVVIEKSPTGTVRIYANRDLGCTLTSVVLKLRWEEQLARHEKNVTDWQDLSADGKVAYWHYSCAENMISSRVSVSLAEQTTILFFDKIYEIVLEYLYPPRILDRNAISHEA